MNKKRKRRKLREWDRGLSDASSAEDPQATPEPSVEGATAVGDPAAASFWAPLKPSALLIPLALVGLLLVLNFRPIQQNDFWMHLRIGEDILETLEVPRVDVYSAVAQGRPFVAHEWLSGVVLALVGATFGPMGFTLLGELTALSMGLLLYFSLPRPARASPIVALAGALAVYLTAFRLVIRPDLFTMLLLAVWTFAIERWRRERERYFLLPLVFLVALWANLHGAFLFGVVTLLGLAFLVTVEHGAKVQRTEERPYDRSHVALVASVAALAALACLLNPQGWRLPWFSLQMTTGQSFEQVRAVTEWQPTFTGESYFFKNFPYLVYACGAWLLLLWSGLFLRLKQRPLFDIAIAGVVSYLALRQNRFIPYVVIFGFPILVRSWHEVLSRVGGSLYLGACSSRTVRALGAIAIAGFTMMGVARGYVLGPQSSATLGWGFGERQPSEEAAFIAQQGIEGVLYNERMPDGAYLIRELFPRVRPVMDMRLDVYGQQLCDEYDATKSNRQALSDYVTKYRVTLALVNRGGWIEDHFRRTLGFRLAFAGSDRSVLVKP